MESTMSDSTSLEQLKDSLAVAVAQSNIQYDDLMNAIASADLTNPASMFQIQMAANNYSQALEAASAVATSLSNTVAEIARNIK